MAASEKFKHMHNVFPSNFHTLARTDKNNLIGNWFSLLQSVETPMRVTLSRQKVELMLGGKTHYREMMHIQVAGTEDLSGILEACGFQQELELEDSRLEITGETPQYLTTKDGARNVLGVKRAANVAAVGMDRISV